MKTQILKFVATAALVLLFSGCAQYYPSSAFLELSVPRQNATVYDGTVTARIGGADRRPTNTLLVYALSDENIQIPSTDRSLAEIVVASLAEGFSAQGLVIDTSGKIGIGLEIAAMGVKVTKESRLYKSVADTLLIVTVRNPDGVYSKKFTREAEKTSFFKPKPKDLEKMLNEQVSGLVEIILQDSGLANEIRRK